MTTSFAQLQAMVYTETNRPDLVAETNQSIFEATLTCHSYDFYTQDRVTSQVVFNTADYIQQLDTSTIPFYRKYSSFRKAVSGPTLFAPTPGSLSDPETGDPITGSLAVPCSEWINLTEVDPDDLIDMYNYDKLDIFYAAGTLLNIKSSTSIINGEFAYYVWPNIDMANGGAAYSSWIADNYPFLIVYKAAGTVFRKIGQDDSTKAYVDPETGLFAEQLAIFKNTNILQTGR